jgi:hypothetical protein
MAASERTELGYFKKGVSGNPAGRRKMPYEIRELQSVCKLEVIDAINSTLLMTREEIKKIISNPHSTMAQLVVASLVQKAIQEGCYMRAQFLMNYVIGRPKTFDMEQGSDETPTAQKVLKGVPSSILLEMVKSGRESVSAE